MLPFYLWVLLSAPPIAAPNVDPILAVLGNRVRTMTADGTLTASGKQQMQGIPFHVDMDSSGAFLLTMGGPFGITSARMYARPDSFLMVNYLLQEVWHGDPQAPQLRTATHLPIPASDLMALMRGRIPGDPSRFSRLEYRQTGLLFACRDTSGVEYVLVDSAAGVVRQYQRKDNTGTLLLDVAFQDVRRVDDVDVPHRIVVTANRQEQTATVMLTSVSINQPLPKPLDIVVPPSFERRSFH